MLIDQIRELKPQLSGLVAMYGASHLRVFGSVARGQERPDSDVDFLVELPRGYDLFGQRMPLAQGLSDLLHRKIDLIPEHELNRHLREKILLEAIEI
jgi:predicted nucleotidyltransferase